MRAEPEETKEETVLDESQVSSPLLQAWFSEDNITRAKAMEIPSVAGAIDEISRTVANIPIKLYRRSGDRVEEIKGDSRVYMLNEETGDTLDAIR